MSHHDIENEILTAVDRLWQKSIKRRQHLNLSLESLSGNNNDTEVQSCTLGGFKKKPNRCESTPHVTFDKLRRRVGYIPSLETSDSYQLPLKQYSKYDLKRDAKQFVRQYCVNRVFLDNKSSTQKMSVNQETKHNLSRQSKFQRAVRRIAQSIAIGSCKCFDREDDTRTKNTDRINRHDRKKRNRSIQIVFTVDSKNLMIDGNVAPYIIDFCTTGSHCAILPKVIRRLSITATCVADALSSKNQSLLWDNRILMVVYNTNMRRMFYFRWSRRNERLVHVDIFPNGYRNKEDVSIWDIFMYPSISIGNTSMPLLV